MQIKSFPFEAKVDLEKNEFEGYASTFGNTDLVGDVVEKGAFKKTIQERMPKNLIKVLWQHYEPMGLPKHLEEDSKGLFVVAKVSRTRENEDRLQLIKDGVVDRLSIGYDVVKREIEELEDGKRIVHLKELKLYEFSPVTFPANEEAIITGVKGRELEELLKRIPQLEQYLKAGHSLTTASRQRIEDAIKALKALLDAIGEPGKPTLGGQEPPVKGIDPEELQSVLSDLRNYRKTTFGG